MTPKERERLQELLGPLRDAQANGKLPRNALIQSARAVIRYADANPGRFTEEDQRQLDELHGLACWAALLYPLTRVNPEMFASERRAKRGASEATPSRHDWVD